MKKKKRNKHTQKKHHQLLPLCILKHKARNQSPYCAPCKMQHCILQRARAATSSSEHPGTKGHGGWLQVFHPSPESWHSWWADQADALQLYRGKCARTHQTPPQQHVWYWSQWELRWLCQPMVRSWSCHHLLLKNLFLAGSVTALLKYPSMVSQSLSATSCFSIPILY